MSAEVRHLSFTVRCLAFAVALLIPLRLLGQGYLPPDDALRHAGKAVSGKAWTDILVLRPDFQMDSHPGWHALLGLVHQVSGASAHTLVLLSVIGLFVAFCLPSLILLRRPEAFFLALAAMTLTEPPVLRRLFLGRPFEMTMAVLTLLCLCWPALDTADRPRWPVWVTATVALGLTAWIHPSWYLLTFPALCFFLARRPRAGARLLVCLAGGVVLAALLTGHPWNFLVQSLAHPYLVFSGVTMSATLATEFQPYPGAPIFVVLFLGFAWWRGKTWEILSRDPVFVLTVAGWLLGFVSARFWLDWGAPAAIVWMSLEIQDALGKSGAEDARPRLAQAAAACLTAFLIATADIGGRFTQVTDRSYLALLTPEAAHTLPDPGGILYTDDLALFYSVFFRRPDAPFRYVLGYEPGLMRPEDLAVYRAALKARTPDVYVPWIARMTPADRLILRSNTRPPVEGLEWMQVGPTLWSGRTLAAAASPRRP